MKLKIPAAAMPVVRIIRREVERPKKLPQPYGRYGNLRFGIIGDHCPMGLCQRTVNGTPESSSEFDYPVSADSIVAFYEWWDAQTDAQAAVDAVWPNSNRANSPRKSKSSTKKAGGRP